jgi:hypothetical protein
VEARLGCCGCAAYFVGGGGGVRAAVAGLRTGGGTTESWGLPCQNVERRDLADALEDLLSTGTALRIGSKSSAASGDGSAYGATLTPEPAQRIVAAVVARSIAGLGNADMSAGGRPPGERTSTSDWER